MRIKTHMKMPKVLIYPRDVNPYQDLLYSQMEMGMCKYVIGPTKSKTLNNLILYAQLVTNRIKGYNIFHLHWTYAFLFPGNSSGATLTSTIHFYLSVLLIRLLGYKLIWTVHNVLPHKKAFHWNILTREFLAKMAHAKIVHSAWTIESMRLINLDTQRSQIIRMGTFKHTYPNKISRDFARNKLNLMQKNFVYLFFGKLEEYKGIRELIQTFNQIKQADDILVIAGACNDEALSKFLKQQKNSEQIVIFDHYINNDEIQLYLNSADVVVCPYKSITTSSTVLLALDFRKKVIVPNIGNLRELPDNLVLKYDSAQISSLANQMIAAKKPYSKEVFELALTKYLKSHSWEHAAKITSQLYLQVLN
jgi:beta-1,4-mannosyltransferase